MATTINILAALDTAYILSQPVGKVTAGVYMVDDTASSDNPSTNEGSYELSTNCVSGDIISWRVEAINMTDEVSISNFTYNDSTTDLFPQGLPNAGNDWTATVSDTSGGSMTYQLYVMINDQGPWYWDPYLVAEASDDALTSNASGAVKGKIKDRLKNRFQNR
ncbi:MAG: hypothetical protein AAF570_04110 [Bacteroidota bacterium]